MQLGGEVGGIPGVGCGDLEYANFHKILNDFRFREHYLIYDYDIVESTEIRTSFSAWDACRTILVIGLPALLDKAT